MSRNVEVFEDGSVGVAVRRRCFRVPCCIIRCVFAKNLRAVQVDDETVVVTHAQRELIVGRARVVFKRHPHVDCRVDVFDWHRRLTIRRILRIQTDELLVSTTAFVANSSCSFQPSRVVESRLSPVESQACVAWHCSPDWGFLGKNILVSKRPWSDEVVDAGSSTDTLTKRPVRGQMACRELISLGN